MREKLKNLLKDAKYPLSEGYPVEAHLASQLSDKAIDYIVEYLLANGVIVPPCKVGDVLYVISQTRIVEAIADEIHNSGTFTNRTTISVTFECNEDCEGCPFEAWRQEPCGEYSCNNEYGFAEFQIEDFGKTVFLTREEAEQALEKMKEGVQE